MLFPRIYKIHQIPPPQGSDPDGWEKIPPPPNATAEQKRRPWFRTTREWAFAVEPGIPAALPDDDRCDEHALVVGENNEFNGASTGVWFGRLVLGQLNTMESAGQHDGFYTRMPAGQRPAMYLLPLSPDRKGLLKYCEGVTEQERNRGAVLVRIKESRRLADDLFFNALRDLNGIPLWRRYAAWLGLRIGGWAAYKRVPGPRQAV